jgi:hypothetical protein
MERLNEIKCHNPVGLMPLDHRVRYLPIVGHTAFSDPMQQYQQVLFARNRPLMGT